MRYIIAILLLTVALECVNAEPVSDRLLQRKAKATDAKALFDLAMSYDTGLGVAKNKGRP